MLLRLLGLARVPVELAEAEVAVGDEGAHAAGLGSGSRSLPIRPLSPSCDHRSEAAWGGHERCPVARAAASRVTQVVPAWPFSASSRDAVSQASVEPSRAPNLTPQRERPPKLDTDLGPRPRAPASVPHQAQEAVDAEPGVPEAGVDHFPFGARGSRSVTR